MKISIVVLNYNGIIDTLACLTSIEKLDPQNAIIETIVVDNASTDDTPQKIKKKFPHITLLINAENLGFAEGNNVGIRFALKQGSDFILVLNNDTVLERNAIK